MSSVECRSKYLLFTLDLNSIYLGVYPNCMLSQRNPNFGFLPVQRCIVIFKPPPALKYTIIIVMVLDIPNHEKRMSAISKAQHKFEIGID